MGNTIKIKSNLVSLLKIFISVYFVYYMITGSIFFIFSFANHEAVSKIYSSLENVSPITLTISSSNPMFSQIGICSLPIITTVVTIKEAKDSEAIVIHPCTETISTGEQTLLQSQNNVHIFFSNESIDYLKQHSYFTQRLQQFYCVYLDSILMSLFIIIACTFAIFLWERKRFKPFPVTHNSLIK